MQAYLSASPTCKGRLNSHHLLTTKICSFESIGGFSGGAEQAAAPLFFLHFQNLLVRPQPFWPFFECCYNCTIRLKWIFHSRGRVGDSAPSFRIFWIRPWKGWSYWRVSWNWRAYSSWRLFHALLVELKEVCEPKSKDKGVELLLSLSVDLIKEKTLLSELGRNKPNNETKGTNH